jgi:hypothetical protein
VRWDKNRDGRVDEIDRHLAALERADAGTGNLVCHENGVVVPRESCGIADCSANYPASDCMDADGDGLVARQDPDDAAFHATCGASNPCGSFDEVCEYVPRANRQLCMERTCAGQPGGCTVFHLSEVSRDNDEVIVQVHYDYSPVPATVLDVHVVFEGSNLLLLDARPLVGLTSRGKFLQARSVGPDRVRLVALGAESTAPIAPGPIAELVFSRLSGAQTQIAFSTTDYDQTWSIAPHQGAAHSQLMVDARWGTLENRQLARRLDLPAASDDGDRLLLYYSFDNPQKLLDLAKVPTGAQLCELQQSSGNCPAEEGPQRAQAIARYDALQRGLVQTDRRIAGVNGPGVFLSGLSDHLELPITLNRGPSGAYGRTDQDFTASFWFYSEGDGASGQRQLLWSHNHATSESTVFAVAVVPRGSTFDLVWINEAAGEERLIRSGLAPQQWTHFALAYSAQSGEAHFYLDGAPVNLPGGGVSVPAPEVQCPQLPPAQFRVGQEGSGIGTTTPQVIYLSSSQNNLFGIEKMDATGQARVTLVREADSSARDVHYSPLVDKIVYSSSRGGNYEIWVANGDGSDARPVTAGFGDTSRGIFARRPRWAPDASGVVFESNIFSRPHGDNDLYRTYRLFFLEYDATGANEFAIPVAGGQTVTSLDYSLYVASSGSGDARPLDRYRLTPGGVNSSNAFWLGADLLQYTVTNDMRTEPRVYQLLLDRAYGANSTRSQLSLFEAEADVRLMAAAMYSPGANQPPAPVQLLEREWVAYEPSANVEASFETLGNGTVRAEVRYLPPPFEAMCWDGNRNTLCDTDEDVDGDGGCTSEDCAAAALDSLFLEYPLGYSPVRSVGGAIIDHTLPRELETQKDLRLSEVNTTSANYVRIEVRAPVDREPILPGTLLATIDFAGSGSPAGFALRERVRHQQLYVNRPTSGELTVFDQTGLHEVVAAAFSPDASRLVLAAIETGRPVVVATQDLSGTSGMRKLSSTSASVEGLQWVSAARALPCNWVGAFRRPGDKEYVQAFRGGLDELKLHSYVRSAGAVRSDAERGHERLAKDLPEGPGSQAITCVSSLECPAYQVCSSGSCRVQTCDPTDPYTCGGNGKCTLAASVDVPGAYAGQYVCAAECGGQGEAAHTRCFSQECKNGPCRYCDSGTSACIECRETTRTVLGATVTEVEGCPDRNSFACQAGSCVTECYSFENGQSLYLCDPSTEYCKQGRCVTFDWSWTDFAPATLSGLGEMRLRDMPYTEAIPQLYPVTIGAYGASDYGQAPRLLVQGRLGSGPPQMLDRWFDIGTITVYNRTAGEAAARPYTLLTTHRLTDLRIKLINPPIGNRSGASTGLAHLGRDDEFCGVDRSCDRRPPSSRATLGYDVEIPRYLVEHSSLCREFGACNFAQIAEQYRYLRGGHQAAILTNVEVQGTSVLAQLSHHKICSYEGGPHPFVGTDQRHLWFGNPATERSNQRDFFYPGVSGPELLDLTSSPLPSGELLLNCNLALPGGGGEHDGNVAGIQFSGFMIQYPSGQHGAIAETANGCTVDTGSGYERCYEAHDARIDFMTQEFELFKTLEFQDFTSFGYEDSSL